MDEHKDCRNTIVREENKIILRTILYLKVYDLWRFQFSRYVYLSEYRKLIRLTQKSRFELSRQQSFIRALPNWWSIWTVSWSWILCQMGMNGTKWNESMCSQNGISDILTNSHVWANSLSLIDKVGHVCSLTS